MGNNEDFHVRNRWRGLVHDERVAKEHGADKREICANHATERTARQSAVSASKAPTAAARQTQALASVALFMDC